MRHTRLNVRIPIALNVLHGGVSSEIHAGSVGDSRSSLRTFQEFHTFWFWVAGSVASGAQLRIGRGSRNEDAREWASMANTSGEICNFLCSDHFSTRSMEFHGLAPVCFSRSGSRARTQTVRASMWILSWP